MIERAPFVDHYLTHDEAELYCLTLDYNGHKDWRLPTFNEYMHHLDPHAIWIDMDSYNQSSPIIATMINSHPAIYYYLLPVRTKDD